MNITTHTSGTWDVNIDNTNQSGTKVLEKRYVRTAYEHTGWEAVHAGTGAPVSGQSTVITPDSFGGTGGTVFVYPKWTAINYSINFILPAGTNASFEYNGIPYSTSTTINNFYNIEGGPDKENPAIYLTL